MQALLTRIFSDSACASYRGRYGTGREQPKIAGYEATCLLQHLPQNVLQDPAVMVVGDFFGCIHARDDGESLEFAVVRLRMDGDWLLGREVRDAFDFENFVTRQPQRFAILAIFEFEREHTHAEEVAPMDALVALRNHRAHAEQARALRGPVARRARACSRSEEHTSELQSQSNLVCRLLLEKKKKTQQNHSHYRAQSLSQCNL